MVPVEGPLAAGAGVSSVPVAPPSRLRRRSIWWAVGAVAAAGIALAALFATGAISLGGSGRSSAVPFSVARSAGEASLDQDVGGNWTVVAATGVDDRSATTVSLANASSFLGTNCTPLGPPGPSSISVPAYSGAWSLGLSPFWIVVLEDPSSGHYGLAAVVNGSTADEGELNGTGCSAALGSLSAVPSTAKDSPAAAKVAWDSEGATAVGVDANLSSETMIAIASYTHDSVTLTDEWIFEYAACGPFVTGTHSEAAFYAVVNLTTAEFVTALSMPTDCPT